MFPIDFQDTCSNKKVKQLLWTQFVVRSISFDYFIWSIPNMVQGLRPISRWSLLIFRSHVQRSRSTHSFEPSVLSTLYILIPYLLALERFGFYREVKREFFTMGHICLFRLSLRRETRISMKSFQNVIKHCFKQWEETGFFLSDGIDTINEGQFLVKSGPRGFIHIQCEVFLFMLSRVILRLYKTIRFNRSRHQYWWLKKS